MEQGYKLLMLNRSLTEDYRPDAVVKNEQEIVIIEVVVTSDRVQKVEDLQTLFSKRLRIDKRVGRNNRGYRMGRRIKTSVALDEDLLLWIDKMVETKRFANRTHAIEYALQKLRESGLP